MELDAAIKSLSVVAAAPELYPALVDAGAVTSLLGLLTHENTVRYRQDGEGSLHPPLMFILERESRGVNFTGLEKLCIQAYSFSSSNVRAIPV